MKKITNILELNKSENKRNKKLVKEATKFTNDEINKLRLKLFLGIGSGLFIVIMGALIKQIGIELSNQEIKTLLTVPTAINTLMNIFSYAFYGFGGAITAYNTKESYDRTF